MLYLGDYSGLTEARRSTSGDAAQEVERDIFVNGYISVTQIRV